MNSQVGTVHAPVHFDNAVADTLICPVCKTCSDYNHVCLGYSEPPHIRPASDGASRLSAAPPVSGPSDGNHLRASVKAESRSPDSPPRPTIPPRDDLDKVAENSKPSERKEGCSARDVLRTAKEAEPTAAGESPESSMLSVALVHRARRRPY